MSTISRSSRSTIFDCDGVILQSNKLKTQAFRQVLASYDITNVEEFISWHKKTGGVSRFAKFACFFRDQLGLNDWRALTDKACIDFGGIVSQGLRDCPYVPGFLSYVALLQAQGAVMSVNTGGAEDEVREIFRIRGLLNNFEVVLGSPTTKYDNMTRLREMGLVESGAVYFGDSKLDFDLARDFDLDFVYVGFESEWLEGETTTRAAGGHSIDDYRSLL